MDANSNASRRPSTGNTTTATTAPPRMVRGSPASRRRSGRLSSRRRQVRSIRAASVNRTRTSASSTSTRIPSADSAMSISPNRFRPNPTRINHKGGVRMLRSARLEIDPKLRRATATLTRMTGSIEYSVGTRTAERGLIGAAWDVCHPCARTTVKDALEGPIIAGSLTRQQDKARFSFRFGRLWRMTWILNEESIQMAVFTRRWPVTGLSDTARTRHRL